MCSWLMWRNARWIERLKRPLKLSTVFEETEPRAYSPAR